MKNSRIFAYVGIDTLNKLDEIAIERRVSRAELIRCALLLFVADETVKKSRKIRNQEVTK